jgi:transcriptional regulator with XRE-family HTH domain
VNNRVQELRELADLTVEQLAERAGMTSYTLRRVELGQTEPAGGVLNKLAEALHVRPADLLDEPKFTSKVGAPLPFVRKPSDKEIIERILEMTRSVRASETTIGVLSNGEQIAVALVLNKPELFPHGGYTILEAVDWLGPDWTAAALKAQRPAEQGLALPPRKYFSARARAGASAIKGQPNTPMNRRLLALTKLGQRPHHGHRRGPASRRPASPDS